MSFQLEPERPVSEEIRRNVRHQIEKALKHLGTNADATDGVSETEAVGEVRKCFKRIRAALRLVRDQLGEEHYHEENWCFRDAARPLTQVRDAGILVETLDKLRHQFPKATAAATFAKIRQALLANRDDVAHRLLEQGHALAAIKDVTTHALVRIPEWPLDCDECTALGPGIGRVYRNGQRALGRAAQSSSVEHLHEWRKQTKYLWHELQLVEPALTGTEKELIDKTHKLSTLLGEDHDLAVLRSTLAADPLAYGGHQVLKDLFVLIDRQRQDLEQQALSLGKEIYKDSPKIFTSRIEASMHQGVTNEKRQQDQKTAETIESRPAVKAGHGQSQPPLARKNKRSIGKLR